MRLECSHTPVWWEGEWWGTRGEMDNWQYWPLFRIGVPGYELSEMTGAIVGPIYPKKEDEDA